MVQSLFESENRKRQQLEQRLQEVKEPEVCGFSLQARAGFVARCCLWWHEQALWSPLICTIMSRCL